LSSVIHPKRNARVAPYASRRYTYTPPARGNAAAGSARASAPHTVMTPPAIQTTAMPRIDPVSVATVLGTRKIPLPMTLPVTIATAVQKPRRGGRRSVCRKTSMYSETVRLLEVIQELTCAAARVMTPDGGCRESHRL
jgi:hypothetical protein